MKHIKLDKEGIINSLEKSFNASEKGCKRPITPTLLGPLRI